MKRFLVRISLLSVVIILGVAAIAQAQRTIRGRHAQSAADPATADASAPPAVVMDGNLADAPAASSPFGIMGQQPDAGQGPPPVDHGAPPVNSVPLAQHAPSPGVATVGYSEAPPEPATGPESGANVLQAVAEADLSPTPESPQFENADAAPPAEYAAEAGENNTQIRFGNDAQGGYRPARMAQEPAQLEPQADNTVPDAIPDAAAAPSESLDAAHEIPPTNDDAPYAASAAASREGTGRPGGRDLEGAQGASLSVEKIAPPDLQVGMSAIFQIKVRNSGTVAAKDVQIMDTIPKGARLLSATPPAEPDANGQLIWKVGRLKPGEVTVVNMELEPLVEGEIGSVATARFAAEASARSVATRPQLTIQVSGPPEVLVGQELRLQVRVANVGSGVANKVALLKQLPDQFTHPAGREVEFSIGSLAPNETREVELTLMAAKPGHVESLLVAQGDGNLRAEDQLTVDVLAPGLALEVEGAERRFLERQATYTFSLSNPGTAPAKNIELHARLPEGVQFIEANNLGEYEAATRTVHWRLEELPAGEAGDVKMIVVPTVEGEQKLAVIAKAGQGLTVQKEQRLAVEGIAGTTFEVVDVNDPIEIGGETTYEIRVVNQGTKTATNVQIVAVVPEGMKPVDADGPTPHLFDGGQVTFQPLARLAPKADTTFHIKAQSTGSGDMRLRVQLLSDEMRTPVTKEESTRVYADE